ncbi:hypothetical protein F5Y03DRAFT_397007 [Xylaria venustula]|nr:hypothetical protein F5Y03DRAFT_397007 [Xylaria venustula]
MSPSYPSLLVSRANTKRMAQIDPYTVIKEIRFGTRFIRAPAQPVDSYRTVYRVEIPPSPIDSLLCWLPFPIRTWAESLFPEWFLPSTVILKERNPKKPEWFRNEVDIYRRLRHIQGVYIPRCFGTAVSDEFDPALVLSYVEGTPLGDLELEELLSPRVLRAYRQRTKLPLLPNEEIPNPRLLSALQHMYDVLTQNGVVHNDPCLYNFLRVNESIVALDLESCNQLEGSTNKGALTSLIQEIGQKINIEALHHPEREKAQAEALERARSAMIAEYRRMNPTAVGLVPFATREGLRDAVT